MNQEPEDDYTQCESCGGAYPPADDERSADGDACAFCGRRLPEDPTEEES